MSGSGQMSIGFDLQPPAARADRTPDLNEALRFLSMLAPETTAFAFRIFTDAKPKPKPDRLARNLHGILDALANDLTNTNARGAGIYVQINASDGAGQTRKNIKSVNRLPNLTPDRRPILTPSGDEF